MSEMDDFRLKSHHLLIELDAATSEMMMLISSKEVTGPRWQAAASRHNRAFEAWHSFLNSNDAAPTDVVSS